MLAFILDQARIGESFDKTIGAEIQQFICNEKYPRWSYFPVLYF